MSIAAVRPCRGPAGAPQTNSADIAHALCRQSPDGEAVAPSGYIWKGRPPFIDEAMVMALRSEAAQVRASAVRATKHLLLEASPAARSVLSEGSLGSFVEALTGLRPLPSSTYYHWYETEQDFVEPHVDTEEFAVSMLLVLSHDRPLGNAYRSGLFLWPPASEPVEIPLEKGEAVLFYSGSVVHARSAPGPGESVTTVSWGFGRALSGGGAS